MDNVLSTSRIPIKDATAKETGTVAQLDPSPICKITDGVSRQPLLLIPSSSLFQISIFASSQAQP
jgi:hypothetical protein